MQPTPTDHDISARPSASLAIGAMGGAGGAPIQALGAGDSRAVDALPARRTDVRLAVNLSGSMRLKPAAAASPAEFDQTIAQDPRRACVLDLRALALGALPLESRWKRVKRDRPRRRAARVRRATR